MSEPALDVVIVGAGIIGLAAGVALTLQGRPVTIVDRDPPASGCSAGNAGYLSEGAIFPIASPETFRALPRLLLDQAGPLCIRPTHLLGLAPWGLRLLAASRPAQAKLATDALAALTQASIDSYGPLLAAADAGDLVERRGGLHVFRDARALDTRAALIPLYADYGIEARRLDAGELAAMEPALGPNLAGALFFPNSARCLDPKALGQRFAGSIEAGGGRIVRATVKALRPTADGWLTTCEGEDLRSATVLVAAGRWSDALLSPLGYRAPLEAERGYHLMLPTPGVQLQRPLVVVDRHFAITPMTDGLRLAGTVEFAGRNAAMNPARADMLFDQAAPLLPGLDQRDATRWMGHRPSLPDSLPAIGAATGHAGLYYAFGHHHCGLTQAAITARILADLMSGAAPPIDIAPFDIRRFGGPHARRLAA
jgi:glycine/D-amino acid oxidase-like deaminating enzyme